MVRAIALAQTTDWPRALVVIGCALALILARQPLPL
jgi:hypothetical protein